MDTHQIPRYEGRHRLVKPRRNPNRLLGSLAFGAAAVAVFVTVASVTTSLQDVREDRFPPVHDAPGSGFRFDAPTTTTGVPTTAAAAGPVVSVEPEVKPSEKPVETTKRSARGPTPSRTVPTSKRPPEPSGWGAPDVVDEFDYTGKPDSRLWSMYDGPGHAGNGRRTPDAFDVRDGVLTISGDEAGNAGGMSAKFDRAQYGRWEARVRSSSTGAGHQYHPLLLIWPDSNQRVRDGEYDWMENGAPGETCIEAFMHFPGETPRKQAHFEFCDFPGTLADWQVVAFEWTPDGVSGFINGKRWFHTNEADIAEMPSGHLAVQLDAFHGDSGYAPATYQIDYVRYWRF